MKILLSLVAILITSGVCTGQSQSAVRLPSSYRGGVKWALATNYQPLTLLETVATPEEEGVVYILPAAEHGIQNYALHTYANGHSAPVTARPTGVAFSTTELPPTFVSSHVTVPESKLRVSIASNEYNVRPTELPSFVSHVTPVPTGIKSSLTSDYQKVPLNTYNIAHDYLTNLLSRSSELPKPHTVSDTYTPQVVAKSQILSYAPQVEAKSQILSSYTPQVDAKSQIVSTYTPQVAAKLHGAEVVSTYTSQVTPKPFGSIVPETYTPQTQQTHLSFSEKYTPILSPNVYSAHLPVNGKTANLIDTFGSGLSLQHYQPLELKPIVSSTTYKPDGVSSKDDQTLSQDDSESNGYKYEPSKYLS